MLPLPTLARHLTMPEIEAGLVEAGTSPQDNGIVEMIVARPNSGERLVLEQAEFNLTDGLIGDSWLARGSKTTEDGSADPYRQITIMNSRIVQLLAQDRGLWILAGDQLFIDLDLSADNLQPGQQIAIGTTIVEVTDVPHNGCDKFTARYGHDAIRFVNSAEGRQARRRGLYVRVIQPGTIRVGDIASKINSER